LRLDKWYSLVLSSCCILCLSEQQYVHASIYDQGVDVFKCV